MRSSLANRLRDEDRRTDASRSPLDRLAVARRLGDESLARYAEAHGVDLEAARCRLEAGKQSGRRRSACARDVGT